MSRGSKTKTENARSSLLSLQENEKLEEQLGRRCAVSSDLTREGIAHCVIDIVFFLYVSFLIE